MNIIKNNSAKNIPTNNINHNIDFKKLFKKINFTVVFEKNKCELANSLIKEFCKLNCVNIENKKTCDLYLKDKNINLLMKIDNLKFLNLDFNYMNDLKCFFNYVTKKNIEYVFINKNYNNLQFFPANFENNKLNVFLDCSQFLEI